MSINLISTNTTAGEVVIVQDRKIVPFAQALCIRVPQIPIIFTWNRPASVLIIDKDGREEVIAVSDVTRRIQLSFLGLGLIGSIIIWITFKLLGKSRS